MAGLTGRQAIYLAKWQWVGLTILYYAAARFGLMLALGDTNVSPVWPPAGLALGLMLLLGSRCWPVVVLGAFAANLESFTARGVLHLPEALLVSLVIALGNAAECVLAAGLLRRWSGQRFRLHRPGQVYCLLFAGALGAALGAAIGCGAVVLAGLAPVALAPNIGLTWWTGDWAGIVVVAPLVLAWRRWLPLRWTRWWQVLCELGILLLVLFLVFASPMRGDIASYALGYLVLPCIGWAAYRHGLRGATLVQLLCCGAAVWGGVHGTGPFANGTLNEALVAMEVFVCLCSVAGLLLAADLTGAALRRERARSMHWGALFLCLALTIVAWQLVSVGTLQRARDRFDYEVDLTMRHLRDRMASYGQVLVSAQAAYDSGGHFSRGAWGHFVAQLQLDRIYPGLQGLGLAFAVPDAERARFEQVHSGEGWPQSHIRPAGQRDDYIPITYLAPDNERNRRALGFDLGSEPVRRHALVRARETGELSVTGKIQLVQSQAGRPLRGFLMVLPLYAPGVEPQDWGQRQASLQGYVYAVFAMDELMGTLTRHASQSLELEVFDGAGTSSGALLYGNPGADPGGRTDYPNALSRTASLTVGDAIWTVRATSLPVFEQGIDRQKPLIVLLAGSLISLLFFHMSRTMASSRAAAVSRAQRMQSAFLQSEQKLSVLLDSASEFAIIATDLDGVVQVFSVGAERMLGYRAETLVGIATLAQFHQIEELVLYAEERATREGRPPPPNAVAALVAQARQGQPESSNWTYVRRDGGILPVQLTISPIYDAQQTLSGYLAIARDITQQRNTERELRAAVAHADNANRAKSEFVANMSHELRTPLNAVLGMAYLLSQSDLTASQRHDLDLIRHSGQSLLAILNDILDFSKIEAGKMELAPAPFVLDELLASLGAIMNGNARERDLELVILVEPGVPQQLVGDAMRLQQVLVNLAGNAVKFTEHGEVEVRVDWRAEGGGQLLLSVRDSGIGMSADVQQRLFSPFTQADSSSTRRFGGTGLGLTISRRLLDMMGGTIVLDSEEGKGSCFRIAVPLGIGARLPMPPAAGRVLVIDDHPLARLALRRACAQRGWEVAEAPSLTDGVIVLAAERRARRPVDAVLLDWGLVQSDPVAMLAALRRHVGERPLLLMMSAYGRSVLAPDLRTLGADGELDKPVLASQLLALSVSGAAESGALGTAAAALQGHVLLVEDNPLNQVVASGMLRLLGLTVEVAADGEQALQCLRFQPERFQLVLMDVQMPVLDGFDATRRLREELGLVLPVLAMTAGVMEHDRQRCTECGMNDFISKPVRPAQLQQTLARYLPLAPVASAPAAVPQEAAGPPFDPAPLMEIAALGADHLAMLADVVGKAVRQGMLPLDMAHAAWQASDHEGAARALHTLRGSIGSMGGTGFVGVARQLEQALRAHEEEATAAMFPQARAMLHAVLQGAQAWLDQVAMKEV